MSIPLKPLAAGLLVGELVPDSDERTAGLRRTEREQRLESWFRDHFDALWRLALRFGTPRAGVDDVVQETFIIADRRASDIAPGCERRFLISTLIKLCANQRRRCDTRQELPMLADAAALDTPDAEQLLTRKRLREGLGRVLDELPLEQRTVFVLHQLEGLSIAEIAQLIEAPAGTVASRLARARSKFSKLAGRLRARWSESEPKGSEP